MEKIMTPENIEIFNYGIENKPVYSSRVIADGFLKMLPITRNVSAKRVENAIKYVKNSDENLIIASTVCPPYSSDSEGRPTYTDLGCGIEFNIKQHLINLPPAIKFLKDNGIRAVHFFLMADTEVDLQPFLEEKLHISPDEFLKRCQMSVEAIDLQVRSVYGDHNYHEVPGASRFLSYFGEENWYLKYEYFKQRLNEERKKNMDVQLKIENDAYLRADLINKLLGKYVSHEERVDHIIRQKAQYMAFAALMREKFGRGLIIVNHSTPNFMWMNDRIVREPKNPIDIERGNYLFELPLIELNISTMPKVEK